LDVQYRGIPDLARKYNRNELAAPLKHGDEKRTQIENLFYPELTHRPHKFAGFHHNKMPP